MQAETHAELLPAGEEGEQLILPWKAVGSEATADEYMRKSRFFLEFGGFVDPKMMHHEKGPNPLDVKLEKAEIEKGMKAFIRKTIQEPKFARNLLIKFIESEKTKIVRKEIGASHLRNTQADQTRSRDE